MVAQYRSHNHTNTTQLFLKINLLIACKPLIEEADINISSVQTDHYIQWNGVMGSLHDIDWVMPAVMVELC